MPSSEIQLLLTDALRSEIEGLRRSGCDIDVTLLDRLSASETISLSELKEICRLIPRKNSLKDLLVGSKLVFKRNTQAEASPGLLKRREYLKGQQEKREYNEMVSGTVEFSRDVKGGEIRSALVALEKQFSVILNMLLSLFAMFAVGYYVGGQYRLPMNKRIICGLAGSIIILFVEMALYIIRAMQNDDIREKKLRVESSKPSDPKLVDESYDFDLTTMMTKQQPALEILPLEKSCEAKKNE